MLLTNRSRSIRRVKANAKICAVVVAAGEGSRFGGNLPKQFCQINGTTPLELSLNLFLSLDYIDAVVCVIPEGFRKWCEGAFPQLKFVAGGDSRRESVRLGLLELKQYYPEYVLIHDAVRCFCEKSLVDSIVEKLQSGARAVVPTIRATDSVRVGGIGINREEVEFSQTPQGFKYDLIMNLHEKLKGKNFTDDVALCDFEGIKVESVPGDLKNKKITYKSDVEEISYRTGIGYDAHKFSTNPERQLYLMGKKIDGVIGLEGVSDADVAIHSLIDAILGALSLGSIGQYFSIDDPKNKDADSKVFLTKCRDFLREKRASIVNIDTTIICEEPKIVDHSEDMKEIIAKCLGIDVSVINIKGKTTEGMGFEGRKEGISAMSVVSVKVLKC